MKTITLLTVIAMLIGSATLTSSVGGPLTLMVITLIAILAVGIYEAWSKRRAPLGWIVSITASIIGGALAVTLVGMMGEALLSGLRFQGSLAQSNHPLLYVLSAAMAIFTVFGSWVMIQLFDRLGVLLRRKSAPSST